MWTHAASYKGFGPDKLIHRGRLGRIVKILKGLPLRPSGMWADFGCSDGFILEVVRNRVVGEEWQLFGFDHSTAKLEEARKRVIPNTKFAVFDLNMRLTMSSNAFDVVTCFETIEHTGIYRNAFDNLVASTKEGGIIVVSVPREVGVPGIAKFVGRALIRRRPYRRFFENVSRFHYTVSLLTGRDIERFRDPSAKSWGPHLGFDYRNFEAYVMKNWLVTGCCALVSRELPFPRFNVIYVFRKLSAIATTSQHR
jgi:SAM-dependent methyltransferase